MHFKSIFNFTIFFFIVSCGSTNTGFESNNKSSKRAADEIVDDAQAPAEVSSPSETPATAQTPAASTATQVAAKPNLRVCTREEPLQMHF